MSVLGRAALEARPLADLHAIASELSIDGYRRLRRGELVDALLGGDPGRAAETAPPAERKPEVEQAREAETDRTEAETDRTEAETDRTEPRRRRGRRTARGRSASSERAIAEEDKPERE